MNMLFVEASDQGTDGSSGDGDDTVDFSDDGGGGYGG